MRCQIKMEKQVVDAQQNLDSYVHVADYSPGGVQEYIGISMSDLPLQQQQSRWIRGQITPFNLDAIGAHFKIHPLILEDMQNEGRRPKIEGHHNYVYLSLKIVSMDSGGSFKFEHVDIILGDTWIITLCEQPDILSPILQRITACTGWTCQYGPDYLCYSIIDLALDSYYDAIERFGENIEDYEDAVVDNPTPDILEQIRQLKKQALFLRKTLWPIRDILNNLEHGQYPQFKNETLVYIRNALNHVHQIIDTIETYRDIISGMHDIYLSSVSHKLNEIMKLLTIISTIFIPLTFVSSIYGMNFEYMPELKHPWGYVGVLLLMGAMAIGMLVFFKKRKWL